MVLRMTGPRGSDQRLLEAAASDVSALTASQLVPLDSLDERIRRAIAEKRLLEIRYKRAVHLAEPHDYGVIDGTERLLIFQLHGPDSGKRAVGWRLLDVVKIESCVVTDQTFAGSRRQSAALPMGDAVRARDVG